MGDSFARLTDENAGTLEQMMLAEPGAASRLYRTLAPRARRLATRITSDSSEAEDVVHDAFLEILRRAPEYSASKASVTSWALMIVRSRAIDRVRRRKTRVELQQNAAAECLPVQIPTPEMSLAAQRLLASVALLPRHQRRVVSLVFINGFTNAEAARQLDMPLGTVKSRIARALRVLRADNDNSGSVVSLRSRHA